MSKFDFEKLPELDYSEIDIPQYVKDFINVVASENGLTSVRLTTEWVTNGSFGLCGKNTILHINPSYNKITIEVFNGGRRESTEIPFSMIVSADCPIAIFNALLIGLKIIVGVE